MEYFDIVDENGVPTGETVERKQAHALGIRHRTAHIWVVRRREGRTQVLLQKRSLMKDSFPGRLDTSSAGHIQAGDEPYESALRELKEELGIEAQALVKIGSFVNAYETEFYGKPFRDNEVTFVYALEKDVEAESLVIQKEELESAAWFDLEETCESVRAHDKRYCVPIETLNIVSAWARERY